MSAKELDRQSAKYSRMYARAWARRQFDAAMFYLDMAERYYRLAQGAAK